MKYAVDLAWHIVCGRWEVDALVAQQDIQVFKPRDQRHSLFLTIKHPDHIIYKGPWGPELIYYDRQDNMTTGQLGRVWTSNTRAKEIESWLRDQIKR